MITYEFMGVVTDLVTMPAHHFEPFENRRQASCLTETTTGRDHDIWLSENHQFPKACPTRFYLLMRLLLKKVPLKVGWLWCSAYISIQYARSKLGKQSRVSLKGKETCGKTNGS